MLKPSPEAYHLLHDGSIALARMEANGIRIDEKYLHTTINEIGHKVRGLEEQLKNHKIYDTWRKQFGQKTNLGSKQQLGKIVFECLKFKAIEKTPTGRPKVTEDTLLHVIDKCKKTKKPRTALFLETYLHADKLKDTQRRMIGLKKEVIKGLFHANFNLHLARSYRSSSGADKASDSSSGWNLQNVPVRDKEMGELIRRSFIPRKDRRLVENDFSAHEFKLCAILWADPVMMEYASDPTKDIHRDQAAKCYACKPGQVTKDARYCGKNGFVFPKLYGSYYAKIAQYMWAMIDEYKLTVDGVPMKEHLEKKGITELGACDSSIPPEPGTFEHHIKKVEDEFMRKFKVFAKKTEEWYNEYRKNGAFKLVTGFVCPGLYSKNETLNLKIQGPAFHCLVWVIIQIQKWLRNNKKKALLVGEIHDCVLADVPDDELQEYLDAVKRIVEVELPKAWKWITVPLGIEAEVTPLCEDDGSWANKSVWERYDGIWQPKKKVA